MTGILRTDEVLAITGLSRTTIWRLERDGSFPRRRKIGPQAVGWLANEVASWVETRPHVEIVPEADA